MRQRVTELSEGKMSLAVLVKLIWIVCLLIWVFSAAAAESNLKHEPDSNSVSVSQTAINEAKQDEIRELKLGQMIERELSENGSHTYRIALIAGQYLNVTVDQLGVNVEVGLIDPKGEEITNLDWWWREGTESLWALAELTGDYTLKISAFGKPAETGKYRVKIEKIEQWQQASATDKNLVTAYKYYAEGKKLFTKTTAESRREAIEKFQASLPFWRALKDENAEAITLNEISTMEYQSGSIKQAAEYVSQAIPLFLASGNRREAANSLFNLGVAYNFLGEMPKSLDSYNQALPLARAVKDRVTEARILGGLGPVLHILGQTQKALETLDESVSLARAIGSIDVEAGAQNNIGFIYVALGRLREAIPHYNQTLSLLEVSDNRFGRAATLSNIGNAYAKMGEFNKALESLLQGLKLTRSTGDRRREAINLGSIASLYIKLGDYSKALQYADEALTLSRAIGIRDAESIALGNLGVIHGRTGNLQKSLEYFDQSLTLKVQLKDRYSETYDLNGLGLVYSRLGEYQKALDYYEKALTIIREIGDQYGESYTLLGLGAVYVQLGNQSKALESFNQALTTARSTGDRLGEVSSLYQLAKFERARGNITQARSQIEAAIELIESTRTKVSLVDVRAVYFASQQDSYNLDIDLLMQLYQAAKEPTYLADAFSANERRIARSLLDSLAEVQTNIRAGVSPELLERERSLQQDLNAKADQQMRLLSRKHTAEQATVLAKELEGLTTEYEQVLAQIRQASPRYASLTQPAPLSLKQIQSEVLDSDTLLLEYSLGEERSYLWAVTPTSITSFELPKRAEIETAARRVYDLLVAKADALYPEALTALSQMLLKPVAEQLGRKRLLIVSEGMLQYIPFEALPTPSAQGSGTSKNNSLQPLIVTHEIVSLPSTSVLAELRRELGTRKPAPKMVAVLADPVFDKDDQRIKSRIQNQPAERPGEEKKEIDQTTQPSDVERSIRELGLNTFDRLVLSRREAETITGLASKDQSLKALDFTASRATATNPELSQYQIVHFATHSLLNNQHAGLSGIVLSLVDEQGQLQDGFLRLYEVYNLKLEADLVVLSACQTALGKEIKGEGLVGLTRGFMHAGVPRVVASLWKVSDQATAELMQRFYQKMLKDGMRPAAALRAAQISMAKEKQWAAAYYWAGFVLQGEWR